MFPAGAARARLIVRRQRGRPATTGLKLAQAPEAAAGAPARQVVRELRQLTSEDYENLLAFRAGLRRFQHWSQARARTAGLTPAQHRSPNSSWPSGCLQARRAMQLRAAQTALEPHPHRASRAGRRPIASQNTRRATAADSRASPPHSTPENPRSPSSRRRSKQVADSVRTGSRAVGLGAARRMPVLAHAVALSSRLVGPALHPGAIQRPSYGTFGVRGTDLCGG